MLQWIGFPLIELQLLMHAAHEVVIMEAYLGINEQAVIKQVHEHRLTPANRPVKVKTLGCEALVESLCQVIKRRTGIFLRRIGGQLLLVDELLVTSEHRKKRPAEDAG